ncbi:MAG: hypothetical protein GY737_09590 [Desulfobacteraceae bacterium]|nr:hypothetical protein [Desulfobacteraceae bacterium]
MQRAELSKETLTYGLMKILLYEQVYRRMEKAFHVCRSFKLFC